MNQAQKVDGILLVDKPKGFTSHDIVSIARGALGTRKIGHCGTLDPNATGLLVLVVGIATRFSSHLTGSEKCYEGVIRLGATTSTYDAEGEVLEERAIPELSLEDIRRVAEEFTGEIQQIPPMVSAIKKDGVPLYKLARKGVEIERESRTVTIPRLDIEKYEKPDVTFTVDCSKGTYIRSLAFDLGERLGCGAHLLDLRRTRSGKFTLENAVDGASLKTIPREEARSRLMTIEQLLQIYSPAELKASVGKQS